MRRAVELTEMLGTVELPEGPHDLWAGLSGDYDEGCGRLTTRLTASLRHFNMRGPDSEATPGWLPKPENIVECVGPGETSEAAREIFHRWARKVRDSAPSVHVRT